MSEVNPFPYQQQGAEWLRSHRYALLADEMGLGKTVQVITAAERLWPPWPRSALIICPAVAREHWRAEIAQWAMVPPSAVFVPKNHAQRPPLFSTVICSYEYATENADWLANVKRDLLVVDEAHYCIHHTSKRAKAVLGKLIHQATRAWLLTGTPCRNHIGELWIYLYVLGVTRLSQEDFCGRYMHGSWDGPKFRPLRERAEHLSELREGLSRVMLRRTKAQVMQELPSISYQTIRVKVPKPKLEDMASLMEWQGTLQALKDELVRQEGDVEAFLASAGSGAPGVYETLAALAQSSSTLRRFLGLQKLEVALELIGDELEADPGKTLVVAVAHQRVGERLLTGLSRFGSVLINGNVTGDPRQANIDAFNTRRARVFVGSIKACGVGINLAKGGCSEMIRVEREWVPADNEQMAARLHRPPQQLPVLIRDLVLTDSLDEALTAVLTRKEKIISKVLEPSTSSSVS